MDVGCLAVGVVFLPFGLGLGYVLVMAVWRFGRYLWTTGGPRLAEGDPAAWTVLGMVLFFVAVVAFIHWHAGRDGGPNPLPGREVHRGEDWYWEAERVEYPPKPETDLRRPPSP
ncbi:hypothetical protein AB0E83_18970 [Streptomyces sp. NPDC035033]|uniref:hypothetical protein n=1 Tax=Streptomyces sp. NPDC035033 TaxID=3155368 RepID=UPI0033D1AD27